IPFGPRAHDAVSTAMNRAIWHSLRIITGTRFTVTRHGEPDPARPLIVVSNHQSIFDITVLQVLFHDRHPKYIAKQELGRGLPGVSINLRRGQHALIDRSNARQALIAIHELAERVGELECAAVIFPEGTRARRGALKRFRPAGLAGLLQKCPDAVILPVTIDGTWKLTSRKCLPVPANTAVNIVVGPAIDGMDHDSLKTLVDEIQETVRANLHQLRASSFSSDATTAPEPDAA
ncbi:MAG: 1-acyl-sn-glycerol-3-phosphate acyltransferase, partial [Bdellovibrionales bacterium]|nr:1-acyl-sn-glycerol-3-phosphate acyltransferase [Bdellovibrionales bacterium]